MMYCPNCSKEVNPDLHYCNSCGFRLETRQAGGRSAIVNITTGAGFMGVAGLIGFIFLIKLMLEWNVIGAVMVVISLGYLATLFGLVRYMLSFIKVFKDSDKREVRFERPPSPELPARDTNRLEEAKGPPASVVENTTRTLDKVPANKNQ